MRRLRANLEEKHEPRADQPNAELPRLTMAAIEKLTLVPGSGSVANVRVLGGSECLRMGLGPVVI